MIRKSIILSLAATALGVLAMSTTSASAFHFGGGGGARVGGAHFGGMHFSGARVAGPRIGFRQNFQFRRIVRVLPPHHHWHWRWHFAHRPYWIAPVADLVPLAPDPEYSRKYYVRLRELRDRLEKEFQFPLPQLSMGMSGDYRIAVEEGATLVRVGTAIFGSRRAKGQ